MNDPLVNTIMDNTLLIILLILIALLLGGGGFFGYHHYYRISEKPAPYEYVVEKPTAAMPANQELYTENGQRYSVNPNQNLAAHTTQVTPINPGTGHP